jgi:excisionase family DNA binding protein
MTVATIEHVRVLTSAEAAELLELEVSLVCRYCREGRIEAEKVGRDWIITQSAIKKFRSIPRHPGNPTFRKSARR